MTGKLLTTAAAFERLSGIRSREEAAADRIAHRAGNAAVRGEQYHEVRGGLLGVYATTHSAEVYAGVAGQLEEEGLEIVVERYVKTVTLGVPESYETFDTEREYDVIVMLAPENSDVEPSPLETPGRYAGQIYPPPFDDAGPHNVSLHQP